MSLHNPTTIPPEVRALAYCRVSTERQAGEVQTSLADQRTAITSLAARLGVTIGAWYEDAGASGATVEARPAFTAMLGACFAHPRPERAPGFVLVLNDSRFGRFPDPDQAASLRYQLREAGWEVRFAEADEIQDPNFRPVVRALAAAQASEYRRTLIANVVRGMRGTVAQGYWRGREPYGYMRAVVYPASAARVLARGLHKAPTEKVRLAPHPDEAPVVQWLFETYAAGGVTLASLAATCAARAAAGEPGYRYGVFVGPLWTKVAVARILANPAYVGDVVGGVKPQHDRKRRRSVQRAEADRYECRDAHPPLVSRALFATVAARLAENRRRTQHVRSPYLLSGMITCAACGRPMVGGGGRIARSDDHRGAAAARADGAPIVYGHYKCSQDRRGGTAVQGVGAARVASGEVYPDRCPAPMWATISQRMLEGAALATIAETVAAPAVQRAIARAVDAALAALTRPDETGAQATGRRPQRERLEAQRDRLVAAVADGTLTAAEAAPKLGEVRAALAALDAAALAEREARDRARETAGFVRAERDRLLALARDFPTLIARATAAGRRSEVRELIRPWLAAGTFDPVTRVLTLHLRCVPDAALADAAASAAPAVPAPPSTLRSRLPGSG